MQEIAESSTLRNQIAGCFYGLIVGDALGFPVENWSSEHIASQYGTLREMVDCPPERRPKRNRPRGTHSDDGQQAIAVCDALLMNSQRPGAAFADRMVTLLRGHPQRQVGLHRGASRRTIAAITAIRDGTAWDQATAGVEPNHRNGAAMRAGPIGIYFRDDLQQLTTALIEISLVTHRSVCAIAAAGAVAWLVRQAITDPGSELPESELLDFVVGLETLCGELFGQASVSDNYPRFSAGLEVILSMASKDVGQLLTSAWTWGSGQIRTPTSAGGAVLVAIGMYCRSTDYEQTLVDTVNFGGDTDTSGAIVGQLCGARFGLSSIPPRWLEATVAYPYLEDRIQGLMTRPESFIPAIPQEVLELPWTNTYL